ncbi:glycosyltransferase family 4 protein [Acinetobacter indicus]|uniref:glycosyltransferase family 4 protein n=1 Tax=Acinetobacter indicus TaxID=756892 RepID=UPI00144463B3|nr:glycosyltransferase family 4 protein [Acinetobacter indicus]
MKILMIIPSLGSGGAERVLSSLANDWVKRQKCDIELAVLMNSKDFYTIDKNIKVHRIDYMPGSSNKVLGIFNLALNLRKLIKDIKPDICFSFIRESNIITLISTLGVPTKVVISERDSPKAQVSKFYNYLRKLLYPLCNGLIVQTNDYREFITKSVGNINQVVIPNPVRDIDINKYNREKIIISVGRLIPVKGHKYLIDAFSKCKSNQDWKLVILGEGALRKDLEQQINKLNLQDKVVLVGAVHNVDDWLRKSSIFAFTSLSEGFPNALAEAMSASLPCVSFDCITGPKDLIENEKNGYLIEVGDVDNFSKKLDILMQSEKLRYEIGKNAKNVANSLDFIKISERYFLFLVEVSGSTK